MSLPINSLYSLTWGDYGTSLVSAVQLLRCHGDLVDVTLAAGGRSFPAHKIVLCAASPFLLDLLKNTPCKHPVVMLAGVNANDLEALLEFVYRGEVSVDHSQLPSLLQAAHCLNIQGLAPQTVTHKDDNTTYTTSIQLHPTLVPQHHVKTVIDVSNGNEEQQLITTINPNQTVVEEIIPGVMTEEVTKDVISQFLPTRKRKPRTKKANPANAKVQRTEEVQQVQQQQQIQQQQQHQQQIQTTENIITTTTSTNIPTATSTSTTATTTANAIVKVEKSDSIKTEDNSEVKAKSQSEQPATCPICSAVIRQSRNLRRHLELRHFKKPGTKKEKKGGANNSQTEQTTDNGTGTIAVSVGNQIVEQSNGQQHQQLVTHENPDGTTSLSIAHVQTLQGHQLSIGNMNQATIIRNGVGGQQQLDTAEIISTHEATLRPHTELFRIGSTVYTIEERPAEST